MAANDCLGFEITELRLGLPGGGCRGFISRPLEIIKNEKKRVFSEIEGDEISGSLSTDENKSGQKNQVVGWPPVCSYRRKNNNFNIGHDLKKMYVKVSMDGAPFLRKIDLSAYEGYRDLLVALEKLFGCYGIGEALNDADSSDYVPIYEDKDGDWMLVGDVPWNMFIESCKRLRIMKKTEAKGIGFHAKGIFKASSRDE